MMNRSGRRTPVRTAALAFVALAVAAGMLGGCSSYTRKMQDSTYDYGSRQKNDPKMAGSRMYGRTTDDPQQHDNKFFEYSNMLSREIGTMHGVGAAVVMLTDKNAYVAIALTQGGNGTIWGNVDEQDNGGAFDGVYNNKTGSSYGNGTNLVGRYNSYLTVNDHNLVSAELKQTIARKIRLLAPRVEEVHISANMDFINDMTDYAKEAWSGRSLQPWVNDFNTLVRYHFADGTVIPVPLQQRRDMSDTGRPFPTPTPKAR